MDGLPAAGSAGIENTLAACAIAMQFVRPSGGIEKLDLP